MSTHFLFSRLRLIGLFILTLLTLTACGALSEPTPAPKPPLRFVYDFWPGYYPALIAQEKGFFAEEGVEVELLRPENTDQMLADFVGGKYDAVAVAFGDVVSLAATNSNIRIIIVSDESAGGDAFVVHPDIQSLNDLEGKTVGVNQGGFAELFVTKYLEDTAMDMSSISMVNADAADVPELLKQNRIQGGHTWEPYVTEAKEAGFTVLFSSANTPGLIPDVVAFRQEFIEERPEDVQAFVNGWFKAVDFWIANPREGTDAAAAVLKVSPDTISLEGIKLMTFRDNQRLFTQGGNDLASLYFTAQLYTDFYARIGTIRTEPNILELLNNPFVQNR